MQDSRRFLKLLMDQNNKCNLKCRMCGFSDPRVKNIPKYDMPFRLFEKIVREVFPITEYLALSCLTEPLMTGDFLKRLDLLKVHTVPFTEIVTNATLLTKPVVSKMIEVPVSRLAVSIDGASPETYEAVRTGARFKKVIENIRTFSEMKKEKGADFPVLRFNHVISEANINEFQAFLDMAESLNVQAIDVRTVIPFRDAAYQGSDSKAFFQQVRGVKEKLLRWTQRTGAEDVGYLRYQAEEIRLFDEKGEKMMCRRPWDSLVIHANGDVLPCVTWSRPPVGNIALMSFREIWDGQALASVRREFEERRPGMDCMHCTIKKNVPANEDDDCFLQMLNKSLPEEAAGKNGPVSTKS